MEGQTPNEELQIPVDIPDIAQPHNAAPDNDVIDNEREHVAIQADDESPPATTAAAAANETGSN